MTDPTGTVPPQNLEAMSIPAAPRFVSVGFGSGDRAGFFTLAAFRVSRPLWPNDHSICSDACACLQRPKGWPRNPVIHPRGEECHA